MPQGSIENELNHLRQLGGRGDHTARAIVRIFESMQREQTGGITARFASTANRASLSGLANTGLDGTPVENDVVLLKDQTDAKQNGIYYASASAWKRVTDDNGIVVLGPNMSIPVREGSTLADKIYQITSNSTVIGTDDIVFSEAAGAAPEGGGDTGYEFMTGNDSESITNSGNISVAVKHTEIYNGTGDNWAMSLPNGLADDQIKTLTYEGTQSRQLTISGHFIHANLGGPPRFPGLLVFRSNLAVRNDAGNGTIAIGGSAGAHLRWNESRGAWIVEACYGIIAYFTAGDEPE